MAKKMYRNQETHPLGLQKKPWPKWGDNWERTIFVDEAGRGALAGPLCVAATCILDESCNISGIHDSKTLKPHEREAVYDRLMLEYKQEEFPTFDCDVQLMPASELDTLRLGQAWKVCVYNAVTRVASRHAHLTHVLIDGNVPVSIDSFIIETLPKADEKLIGVAMASVFAKVTRDRFMTEISKTVDERFRTIFASGKGYRQCLEHEQLLQRGIYTIYHRTSFEPLQSYLLEYGSRSTPRTTNGTQHTPFTIQSTKRKWKTEEEG